jgi:hypothetical protein
MGRRVIYFDTGEIAVVYKKTDIRNKLTHRQCRDLLNTKDIIPIKSTKEQLWIQLGEPRK